MTIKTNKKKFLAYNDIFDVLGNTLKPTGIAVYLCLIRHADHNAQCYLSHKLIATKCGISQRTVVTAISKLLKLDLIKVQKRETNNGGNTSNLYIIKKLPNHIHTEKEALSPAQEIHKEREKVAPIPVPNWHTKDN
jgi:predicted transcriptional regulator